MVGSSSVSANFTRMYAFMWLSGTWWTTCRTVQPPSRYGVSSAASSRPATASRMRAGAAAMMSIIAPRSSGESSSRRWNVPMGYRGSLMIREVYRVHLEPGFRCLPPKVPRPSPTVTMPSPEGSDTVVRGIDTFVPLSRLRQRGERRPVVLRDRGDVLGRFLGRVRSHLRHQGGAGVVRGKRVFDVAVELVEELAEVLHAAEHVLACVEGVRDAEVARRFRLELHDALGADARDGIRVVARLLERHRGDQVRIDAVLRGGVIDDLGEIGRNRARQRMRRERIRLRERGCGDRGSNEEHCG